MEADHSDSIFDFIQGKVFRGAAPPSNPKAVRGKMRGVVTIPRTWDGDLPAMKRIGVGVTRLCLNHMRTAVGKGRANPCRGFSLVGVAYLPDDHPVRSEEGFSDARYAITVGWEGEELDSPRIMRMRTLADPSARAEKIKEYLDEIEGGSDES